MTWDWPVWLAAVAVVVLLAAASGWWLRRRPADAATAAAWSDADAAITAAGISRDGCPRPVPQADRLLARAELVRAGRGGRTAAREATALARQADRLFRDLS